MRKDFALITAFGFSLGLLSAAHALNINFDVASDGTTPITAPGLFAEILPSNDAGPLLDTYQPMGVMFEGGVVLNGYYFNHNSNLLATSDFARLADASVLPGQITIHFASPISAISVTLINGFHEANFMATADTGETNSVHVGGFGSSNDHGDLTLIGSAMNSITFTTDQAVNFRDFGIDNVTTTPVPEPTSIAAVLGGAFMLIRRKR